MPLLPEWIPPSWRRDDLMFINLVIAILVGLTFIAGTWFTTYPATVIGAILCFLILLSLYRVIEHNIPIGYVAIEANYVVAHLMGQLQSLLSKQADPGRMPVYIAQEGLTPASGMFIARLNGQKALVIEGSPSTEELLSTALHEHEGN